MMAQHNASLALADAADLVAKIRKWAAELGFQQVGIADCDLSEAEPRLQQWLARGWNGDMEYMAVHGTRRTRPAELVPGTVRVLSLRMNYFPVDSADSSEVLADGNRAYVARYALGRDYHKVLRGRLQQLCGRIAAVTPFQYRVFTDSAPVMEVELATK